jgi:hypothetical protein
MSKSKMSKEEKAVREALAAVQADTGVQKAQQILGVDTTSKSYQNFQSAGAALEAISAKPGSTTKQIQSALNAYENAYQTQIESQKTPLTTALPVSGDSSSGGSPSGGSPSGGTTVAAVPATPATITAAVIAPPPPPVKTAPIDTVLFDDESTPIEVMTDIIFENIGGHELINIARNDIVNGQQVSYQPIKNLSSIQQQYNPNNILSLQSTSDKYFANFSIKLENKVPEPGTGPNGAYVYLDENTGNMIVEAINLEPDEQIQVEITTSGTIYEAEFGEITS